MTGLLHEGFEMVSQARAADGCAADWTPMVALLEQVRLEDLRGHQDNAWSLHNAIVERTRAEDDTSVYEMPLPRFHAVREEYWSPLTLFVFFRQFVP